MATYYRWRRSTVEYTPYVKEEGTSVLVARFKYTGSVQSQTYTLYYGDSLTVEDNGLMALSGNVGSVTFTYSDRGKYLTDLGVPSGEKYIAFNQSENIEYIDLVYKRGTNVCRCNTEITTAHFSYSSSLVADIRFGIDYQLGQTIKSYDVEASPDTSQGYVYSTSSGAYPNGGVQGDYYYDQRTTVTSPTAPTNLTVPNPITSTSFTVSWQAATSNIPDYPVQSYEVLINSDASPMLAIQTVNETSADITIPTSVNGIPVTGIIVYVRAKDTNGQWGLYGNSGTTRIPVYFSPTLTVPQMVMQGQQATINWSEVDGADSYTLQRKANTDTDWTQVYSGDNLSYSETVGTWTSLQYRVQAVFDGTPGGWAESAAIPVVSSSALVISGTDEDLGVVTNDIPYSISTDTGNQITATITVNNAVIFSGNVGNSTADVIPVLDLITGEGTIVISATVDASGSHVTATRTWTYEKAAITFPNSGSVAQVTKEGENIYPKVLAEGVRLPGGKTLDQVMGFPAQIYTGSYVGTGTSGASNPNTLTFPFVPKIVFIMKDPVPDFNQMVMGLFLCGSLGAEYKDRGYMYAFRGYSNSNNDAALNFPPNSQIACAKIDGNTLSWYSNDSSIQLNLNTAVYHYVALG